MSLNNPNIYDGTRSLIEALNNDPTLSIIDSGKKEVGFQNPLYQEEQLGKHRSLSEYNDNDNRENRAASILNFESLGQDFRKQRSVTILSRENVDQDFRENRRFKNQIILLSFFNHKLPIKASTYSKYKKISTIFMPYLVFLILMFVLFFVFKINVFLNGEN